MISIFGHLVVMIHSECSTEWELAIQHSKPVYARHDRVTHHYYHDKIHVRFLWFKKYKTARVIPIQLPHAVCNTLI